MENAMTDLTLADLSKKMAHIDFAMLSTHADSGEIASRPMSNNRDVDYDGDSYFFTSDDTRMVPEITRDPKVSLSFQGSGGLLGLRPFMMAVEGRAELIRDKAQFEKHWTKDLERWFAQGVDTPGLVLIRVRAARITWWDGEEEGEILQPAALAA
jgi:general stress protein 26